MNRIPRYTLRLTVVVACVGVMIALMVWALRGAHPSVRRFRLHALVDDGAPTPRQQGPGDQLTDPARFLLFDLQRSRAITLRRASDTTLAGPTRQFVPIGSGWQPGQHRLRLSLPQATSRPVWLRFFALAEDPELRRTLKRETEC